LLAKAAIAVTVTHDITWRQTVPVFAGQMHQLIFCEAGDGNLMLAFAEIMKM
jgi:hypothetical protein